MTEPTISKRPKVMSVLAAPDWGGIHAVIERTTPYIVNAGIDRVVVCPTMNPQVHSRLTGAGADVVSYVPQRPRRTVDLKVHAAYVFKFFADVNAYVDLITSQGADLIEVVGLLNLQAVLAARRARMPIVWQLHSTLAPRPMRVVFGNLATLYADVIMTSGAGMVTKHGGLSVGSDRIIPFCAPLDLASFCANDENRRSARNAWGYNDQDIVVGTLGNRGWQKHHEMLVAVAAHLKDKDSRLKFAIVGTDLAGNKEYYERTVLQEIRRRGLDVSGYVKTIHQDRSAMEVLNAFDIFVLTSVAEGASLVTAEAMATGLPIVATNVGSLEDVVVPDRNGYLVDVDDVESMANAIVKLLDGNRRLQMGLESRQIAERQISSEKCALAHLRAYEMAIASRSQK